MREARSPARPDPGSNQPITTGSLYPWASHLRRGRPMRCLVRLPSLPPKIERKAQVSTAERRRKVLPTKEQSGRGANLQIPRTASPQWFGAGAPSSGELNLHNMPCSAVPLLPTLLGWAPAMHKGSTG